MNIISNKYHIVRYGDFATNGNAKILYSIFAGFLCLDDYRTRKSTDCILIALGATLIWTIVEMYLHTSKTRVIKPMFVGLKNYPNAQFILPTPIGALLQGAQEGGVVTTVGLYYGDRIHDSTIIVRLHLFIAVVIANVWIRDTNNKTDAIASKRQINTTGSMLFIGTASTFDIIMLWKHPEHIYRQMAMLSVMVYICTWWTFIAWYRGFRSVEVHVKQDIRENGQQEYITKNNTITDVFAILGYDVLFEVGISYLIFYNIFLI